LVALVADGVDIRGATGATGSTGASGSNGTNGADGQGYTNRGAYAGGTTYAPYDVVTYNGSVYACILASTGNIPTNATYFILWASKGDTGATGSTGAAGVSTYATVTGASVTGVITETKLQSVLIPADSLRGGDIVALVFRGYKTTTSSVTWRLYFNDGDDLTTPTLVATYAATAGVRHSPITREMIMITQSSQHIYGVSSSIAHDHDGTSVATSTLSYNFANAAYFILTAQLNNSADVANAVGLSLEVKRP